ncbi:histidine N-acetyltransferase-like [Discoglossus pictus]
MSDPVSGEFQILPATESDYEELVSISDGIYCGMDYLPFRYNSWLKDPKRRMFVARSEGKLVGFDSFLLTDGGLTAVVEGLRVAPWLRGRGLAGIFQRFCSATLRSEHPEVRYIRLTRVEDPPSSMLRKFRLLHSKAVLAFVLHDDQLNAGLELLENRVRSLCGGSPPEPSLLDRSKVLCLFDEICVDEVLFPKGILIQGWLPLTTKKTNIEILLGRELSWFYSNPNGVTGRCDVTDIDNTDVHNSPNKSCKSSADIPSPTAVSQTSPLSSIHSAMSAPSLHSSHGFLSLGTHPYPVPLGKNKYRFDIDMFGTDLLYAASHILHQLRQGVQKLPPGGSIVCNIYTEKSLQGGLSSLLQGFTFIQFAKEQLVLEMNI